MLKGFLIIIIVVMLFLETSYSIKSLCKNYLLQEHIKNNKNMTTTRTLTLWVFLLYDVKP